MAIDARNARYRTQSPLLRPARASGELRRPDRSGDDDLGADGDHVADHGLAVAGYHHRMDRRRPVRPEFTQERRRGSGRQASRVKLAVVPCAIRTSPLGPTCTTTPGWARCQSPRRARTKHPALGSDRGTGKLTLLARASSSFAQALAAPRYRKGRPPLRGSTLSVVPVNDRTQSRLRSASKAVVNN